MKYYVGFLVVLIFSCARCANEPKTESKPSSLTLPSGTGESDSLICVSGLFVAIDSSLMLWDTKVNVLYNITDKTGKLVEQYEKACSPVKYQSETTHAVLCGISAIRRQGSSIKNLEVTRIDTLVAKTPENVGLPFEFWCLGIGADWSIEICNLEGGIFYENNSDGVGWFSPWFPPEEKSDTWTYKVPAAEKSGELIIVIKKQAKVDPKNNKKYDYTVEARANGKKLQGVAIRGTGPVDGPK